MPLLQFVKHLARPMTTVEFLIEPFDEGRPGPHVSAALGALDVAGFAVEVGAFSSSISGDVARVADGVRDLIVAALGAGATRIQVHVSDSAHTTDAPGLRGALDRLVAGVESELGGRLPDLSRENKQAAVRLLDDRGAFLLRRSVEDVAELMDVSRITIYNYLNVIERR